MFKIEKDLSPERRKKSKTNLQQKLEFKENEQIEASFNCALVLKEKKNYLILINKNH